MSTMLIRESSDLQDITEYNFEPDQEHMFDATEDGTKIFKSRDLTDKRMINIYRLKRWSEDFKIHKGKSAADLRSFEEKEF